MEMPKSKAFVNLTGRQFDRLFVLAYAGAAAPDHPKQKQHLWLCSCACGNEAVVRGAKLTNKVKPTRSCGCLQKEAVHDRIESLVDNEYDLLTVKSFDCIKGGQVYWNCECRCGRTKSIAACSLKSHRSKSCGCKQGGFVHGLSGKPGYKRYLLQDPVKKLRHYIGRDVNKAIRRGGFSKNRAATFAHLPYTPQDLKVHLESLWESWMSWDNYGGKSSDPRRTWHIDHIKPQSSFSYTSMTDPQFLECWALSNLRPMEKIANIKKGKRHLPC